MLSLDGPTITVKSPGSTTSFMSRFTTVSSSGPMLNEAERLTCLDGLAVEGTELHDGLCHRCHLVVDVELRHLLAVATARVGHVERHNKVLRVFLLDAEVRIFERGVAQSVAEGIKGLCRHLNIVLCLCFLVVVDRELATLRGTLIGKRPAGL